MYVYVCDVCVYVCVHACVCVYICVCKLYITLQTVDSVPTTNSPAKQPEQKSQDSEGKATSVFSDESSESLVSVRSDETISIKGSPVKKSIAAHTAASSEPLETSTEEVDVTVSLSLHIHVHTHTHTHTQTHTGT